MGCRFPTPRKRTKDASGVEFLPTKARISESVIGITRCADNGADAGGDKSDARCTWRLAARNNMNIDSRHMDSSEHMDADNIHKDNNLGTSDTRSSRSEIQN